MSAAKHTPRSEREIETATDIYLQLQYLGLESLRNLLSSVAAEMERKDGNSELISALEMNLSVAKAEAKDAIAEAGAR